MTRYSAPGKLYLAGEHAVVTPGQPAILMAVDRLMHVDVAEVPTGESGAWGRVHSTHYADPLRWSTNADGEIRFADPETGRIPDLVSETLVRTAELARARNLVPRALELTITSELVDAHGTKFGLGSSGAVTVALVQALAQSWRLELTDEERYRLALLITLRFSPHASGGDLATSTLGGWVRYAAPEREAVAVMLAEHGLVATLEADWPGLELRSLPVPRSVQWAVGWTGSPADTDTLVAEQRYDAASREQFLTESRAAVDDLTRAVERDDAEAILQGYAASRDALLGYDARGNGGIETMKLRKLREIAENEGAIAKPSGAGGGDCGVVMCERHRELHRMKSEWHKADITELSLSAYLQEESR